MTIDEAIKREKDIIENKKIYAEIHCVTQEFYADIEYLEQLAEWLEELKAIRQWKSDIMEDFCRYNVNSFEELINNTRKKTIDEFVKEICKKYTEEESKAYYKQYCVNIKQDIADIAEQLKEGDSNGT